MLKTKRIVLNVTNQCNLRCCHCYRDCYSGEILDYKKLLAFIEMLNHEHPIENVIISGGEPFLYNHFFDILGTLNGHYNIRINSNGLLLDQNIKQLLAINKMRIQISLDGYDSYTYKEIRNSDSYNKVINNVIKAQSEGLNVILRATLTKKTLDNYTRFIDLSKSIDVPLIIKPMVYTGLAQQKRIALSLEDVKKWYDDVNERKLNKYVGVSILNVSKCPIFEEDSVLDNLIIEPDGGLFLCTLFETDKYCIGNLFDNTLKEISDNRIDVSHNISSVFYNPICNNCEFSIVNRNKSCVSCCFFKNCSNVVK